MLRTEAEAEDALLPRLVDAVIRYGLVLTPTGEEDDR